MCLSKYYKNWTKFSVAVFHYSIIKIFCSREQSTSHASARSHLHRIKKYKQWKLQNCEILRNVLWRPQGILRCFFGFLCSAVLTILSGCLMELFGPCFHVIMEFMDSDVEGLFLTQNCFSQEGCEPNFSMVRTDRSTECFSRPLNDCYRWLWRIWKEEGILNTAKNTDKHIVGSPCLVWIKWEAEHNDFIVGDSETVPQVNPDILNITGKDELNYWLSKFVIEV